MAGIRVSMQQREFTALDSYNTLKELFELVLEGFLRHIKIDRIIPQEELVRFLWDKFATEIGIFGKNISH